MASRSHRLARPGMPPRWAQLPKATRTCAFRRSRWAISSCSVVRMAPLMKAASDRAVRHRLDVLVLEVHGHRPEDDVDRGDHVEDVLGQVDDGLLAAAAGGAPVEGDFRLARSCRSDLPSTVGHRAGNALRPGTLEVQRAQSLEPAPTISFITRGPCRPRRRRSTPAGSAPPRCPCSFSTRFSRRKRRRAL